MIPAYEQKKAPPKLPGYVPPKYDEYDYEEFPAASKPASGPKQPSAAEQPRGPHKPPAERTQAKPGDQSQFGAGIFD